VHGEFTRARRAARHQQRAQVRPGDEQHQRDRPREHEQRRSHVAGHRRPQILDPRRPAVGRRVLQVRPHRGDQRLEVAIGLIDRGPAREAADEEREVEAVVERGAIRRQRRPAVHSRRQDLEGGGHHADDFVRLIVQLHRAADDRRIAPEARAPETVAEDEDLRRARPLLVGARDAAEQRPGAERFEEVT
jgi:hypothetical protein